MAQGPTARGSGGGVDAERAPVAGQHLPAGVRKDLSEEVKEKERFLGEKRG